MSLKATILNDIKIAMKAKDKETLGTVRMLTAAIKQVEVDERRELSDADVLGIVSKMIKQRKDAADQFEQVILEAYLPEQLSNEEVAAIVKEVIDSIGATGMQDMGKVMGLVKDKVAGQADMGQVGQIVKASLS